MLRFAIETGVVGGDQIHQLLDLLSTLRRLEHGTVILVRFHFQCPQPFAQSIGKQGLLVRAKPDAAVFVNQVRQRPIGLAGKHMIGEVFQSITVRLKLHLKVSKISIIARIAVWQLLGLRNANLCFCL